MELIINQSREDIWQFHKFVNSRTTFKKMNLVLNVLTYPLILLFLQAVINTPLSQTIFLTLFFTVLWIPMYFWSWKSRIKRAPYAKGSQLGVRTIGITPDRIYEKTAYSEEFHLWRGILDIAQNQDYIFLFTDAYAAYLIPKRSFNTASEAQSFFNTALSYWKAVRAQDDPARSAGE
jgi:hypothetical protein